MNGQAASPENQTEVVADPRSWRICAVIVTFHPDEGFCARALRIAEQVDGVVIVDNGSKPTTVSQLVELASSTKAHLILNSANLGVAAAQNQGLEYARAHLYSHGVLFDHDTEPLAHMVGTIRRVASTLEELDRIAAVGINFFDATTLRPWYGFDSVNEAALEVKRVVSSGTLIPLRVVAKIGGFREDFFIDHLEDEYCLRARSRGYKIIILCEPLATHAVGTPKIHRLPWRTIGTTNHAAVRWYYIMRNHILLVKEYGWREPMWALESLYTRLKSIILAVLFDDDRAAKMRLMWRGFVDGVAGRTGEIGTARRPQRS